MGFDIDVGISALAVFAQGALSFFSPCVLPLLPVYMGYLSGGTLRGDGEGFSRGRTALNTLFFVLGIGGAFFLLGLGMTALGRFFSEYRGILSRVGGVIVLLFGLYQLGAFGAVAAIETERRLPFAVSKMAMSPLTALVMGFLFSFAWTPCVGPALSSVLIMAASASGGARGFLLIGVYTLGFTLPFMAVGLFTSALLELFKKHRSVVKYTVKIGGVIMVIMGLLMITGLMDSISGALAGESYTPPAETGIETAPEPETEPEPEPKPDPEPDPDAVPSIDFELADQYGETHRLSDYTGRVVFLNFWATWCPPCRAELPDIQKLYEEYGDDGEVVILGVASPGIGSEQDEDGVRDFLTENGITYPVLMDTTGEVMNAYYITALPTTFMIDRDGNIFGYVPGMMTEEVMRSVIQQTMDGR